MPPITALCLCNALIAGVLSLSVSFCRFSVWPRPRRSWIYGEITDYSCTLLYVCPCWCLLFLRRNFVPFSFVWVGFSVCVCVYTNIYICVRVLWVCYKTNFSWQRDYCDLTVLYIHSDSLCVYIYLLCVCVCVSILCMYYIMRTVCVDHVKAWKQTSEKSFVLTLPTDEVLCVCVTLFPQYVPQNLYPVYKNKVVPVADIITPNQFEAE